jgi:hypothetical protein
MTVVRGRLLVAAVLFFGWLCWLGYLAWFKTNPVVVSHSQVMAASRFVVAEVHLEPDTGALSKEVKVVEDLRPAGPPLPETITVTNLDKAEIAGNGTRFRDGGHYLLPLTPNATAGPNVFELTRPPGRIYRPPAPNERRIEPGRPWAYAWDNADVRRQFEALVPKR